MSARQCRSNTTTRDIIPKIGILLADKEWHSAAEVIGKVGETIMQELAVRFYQNTGSGAKQVHDDPTPLADKIRKGRRRGVYQAMKALVGQKIVEEKVPKGEFDVNEFRLIKELPAKFLQAKDEQGGLPPDIDRDNASEEDRAKAQAFVREPKPKKRSSPKVDLSRALDGKAQAIISSLEATQQSFSQAFPDSEDWRDFNFHIRSLSRIVAVNAVFPSESVRVQGVE